MFVFVCFYLEIGQNGGILPINILYFTKVYLTKVYLSWSKGSFYYTKNKLDTIYDIYHIYIISFLYSRPIFYAFKDQYRANLSL